MSAARTRGRRPPGRGLRCHWPDADYVDATPIEDRAAVVYDVEFLRAYVSGRSVAVAHRVAVAQVAIESPGQAGAAFLMPGLVNGYGKIERRLGAIEGRLSRIERGLGIEAGL